MQTRQFINDTQTSLKLISADAYIPARYIFYEAQNITANFLKKDSDAKKKLQMLAEGWSEIDCVELEEIPVIQCGDVDVRLCDKMMRSKYRLPNLYTYSYGNIIAHVASINFSYFFDPTTPRTWNNIQKQQYKLRDKYYYFFIDGYLYIPIPKNIDLPIEILRIKGYFMNKLDVEKFKALKDCKDCKAQPEVCASPMDFEMVIPSYLIDDVKMELLNRLLKTFIQIPEDTYPNLNVIDKTNTKDLQNNRS